MTGEPSSTHWRTLTTEEFNALITERDALRGELQVVKVERDLLQEKLKAYLRKLFAAKSEAAAPTRQISFSTRLKPWLAPTALRAGGRGSRGVTVAGHQRVKRGRRPLDPALEADIVFGDETTVQVLKELKDILTRLPSQPHSRPIAGNPPTPADRGGQRGIAGGLRPGCARALPPAGQGAHRSGQGR